MRYFISYIHETGGERSTQVDTGLSELDNQEKFGSYDPMTCSPHSAERESFYDYLLSYIPDGVEIKTVMRI